MVLCGISRCFHLLSPILGQIAHALLTRPPLERILLLVPARLACVRHAASVRPEPGSNSDVQSSFPQPASLGSDSPKPSPSSASSRRLLSQKSDCSFCFLFLCIVFKDRAPRLSRRQVLVYHAISVLSTPFFSFFASLFAGVGGAQIATYYNLPRARRF